MLSGLDDYLLPAGQRAEAVAVGYDARTAHLDKLCKLRIVDLGAYEHDLCSVVGLLVRFAGLELLSRLAQLIDDEVLRAYERYELDDVELVAGDGRVIELAVAADLGYEAADLVMALDSVHELFVGIVDAIGFLHGRYDLLFDLAAEISGVPVALLYRHVDARGKEFFVGNELAVLKILLHAVHCGAAFLTYQGGDKIVSAFKRTLEYALGIRAGAVCHIIGRKIRVRAARCAQSYSEAALNIEQRLGYVRAVIGKRKLALGARLLNKRVVCLL